MVTKEVLIKNGFESESIKYIQEEYFTKLVPIKSNKDVLYKLTVWNGSNTIGREWAIQIDNERKESCGSVDFQTIEQFNMFMELLDIDFKM